MTTKVYDRMMV